MWRKDSAINANVALPAFMRLIKMSVYLFFYRVKHVSQQVSAAAAFFRSTISRISVFPNILNFLLTKPKSPSH